MIYAFEDDTESAPSKNSHDFIYNVRLAETHTPRQHPKVNADISNSK